MSDPVWSDWSDEDAYLDGHETKGITKCEDEALLSDQGDNDMTFKKTIVTIKSFVKAASRNIDAGSVETDSLNQRNICKEIHCSREAANAKDNNTTEEQQSSKSSIANQPSSNIEKDEITKDSQLAFTTKCANKLFSSAKKDNDMTFKETPSTKEISKISVIPLKVETNSVEHDASKQRNSSEQGKSLSETVNANDDISQQQRLTDTSEDNQTSPAIEQNTKNLDTEFIKKCENGTLLSKGEENDVNLKETIPTNKIFDVSTSKDEEAASVETNSLNQRNSSIAMNCISETENAKDNITEEQQSTNSSIDNQPSSNKDKDSRTTNIIKSDSEIFLHTQNNDEMNFKENPINDNSFDKVELSNDLTDGRSDSQFMHKKSKSVPGLKKHVRQYIKQR